MTGFISNLEEVLPEADAFLMTSKTEGLGTSVLDAFASRVPVVATRAGGIPEMVIHQETGLLAEVGDAAMLAENLKILAQNAVLKKQLVENAYQHLLNQFTKEKMAQGTVNIYQSLLGG